jgi:hypothetical protein
LTRTAYSHESGSANSFKNRSCPPVREAAILRVNEKAWL